jgi:hypothetical protein|tara:strand:- start:358 stop:546 length:189 start_codon:yes stop_codon:yes gene_type:complete
MNAKNYNAEILKLVSDLENKYDTIREHYKTLLSQYAHLVKKYNISEYEQVEDLKEKLEKFYK